MIEDNGNLTTTIQVSGSPSKLKQLLAIIQEFDNKAFVPQSSCVTTDSSSGDNGHVLEPNEPITEKMAKRLYAIAKSNNYTDEQMNSILKSEFGYSATWGIKAGDYETICTRFVK